MHTPDLSGLNILLIDDSRSIRTVLTTLLRGLGVARIYESRDSEEALVMARLCRPDLTLVDYDLGQESGLDLIRRFRDPLISPNTALAMILLAPSCLPHLVRGALEAGVNAVLPKPVNAGTLGQRISQVLAASESQAAPQRRYRA